MGNRLIRLAYVEPYGPGQGDPVETVVEIPEGQFIMRLALVEGGVVLKETTIHGDPFRPEGGFIGFIPERSGDADMNYQERVEAGRKEQEELKRRGEARVKAVELIRAKVIENIGAWEALPSWDWASMALAELADIALSLGQGKTEHAEAGIIQLAALCTAWLAGRFEAQEKRRAKAAAMRARADELAARMNERYRAHREGTKDDV